MPPAPDRPGNRRVAFLAFVVVVALGLALSELLVRLLLPYNTPETVRMYSLQYEHAVFARSRLYPANRLVHVDAGKAWGTKDPDAASDRTFHINELGFRGPSFAPRKPAGTTRIFVLGGSAVFDQNVSDDSASFGSSWPNRAGALLRARGFDVEVINAGTPAHSTADAVGRLVTELWLYEPDIVVLYSGWNDLKNFRAEPVTPESPLATIIRPYEPASDPLRSYMGTWDRLLCSSQLYVKFRNLYLGRSLDIGDEGLRPSGLPGSDYGPFGPRQYELAVRSFVDIARSVGARPVLATQATLVLNPDSATDARIGYSYQLLDRAGLLRAYDDLYRSVRTVASEREVPVLDAGAALNGDASNFDDHVHLSAAGSARLAALLADFLAGLLGPTPVR